ncbi:MAG: 23S rRNA (uracil(1939)-C(5))-methyltransferase RlmD [Candidatus Methylomirabilales bacterium]
MSQQSRRPPARAPAERARPTRTRIDRLVFQGNGMGRLPDGRVVFVPYTVPGDEVEIAVRERGGDFAQADLLRVLAPGPARVAPPCPHFGRCGGCQWQHLAYPAQLEWKRRVLEELLLRVGKLEGLEVRQPLVPAGPWGYRARAQFKVTGPGRPRIGFHQRDTHTVVDVERCPLLVPPLNAVLHALRGMQTPNLTALFPGVREVWVAAAAGTPDVLVSLFAPPRERGALRLLFHTLRAQVPGLCGVVLLAGEPRENPRATDWHGQPALREEVAGHRFRVGATGFFQVSGLAAGALTALVLEAAGLTGRERVLDLYGGVGTFTVPLAHRAAETVGVEGHPAAAADAGHNLARNACPAARMLHADVEQALADLAPRGPWDVVVLDPPRHGCSPRLLELLAGAAPRRVVYVSCDPSTLARDLGRLAGLGYVARWLQPLDLFPHTFHLETVALVTPAGFPCVAPANPG